MQRTKPEMTTPETPLSPDACSALLSAIHKSEESTKDLTMCLSAVIDDIAGAIDRQYPPDSVNVLVDFITMSLNSIRSNAYQISLLRQHIAQYGN